jgi:hypothetical protein
MLWVIGAIVVGLLGTACGVSLGARVSKGAESVWQPAIWGWAIGFHGAMGVLSLWMLTRAVG